LNTLLKRRDRKNGAKKGLLDKQARW